jgi:hypothetical protein
MFVQQPLEDGCGDRAGDQTDIIPRDTFSITDFGVMAGDTSFLNTGAINSAIVRCHDSGGGAVIGSEISGGFSNLLVEEGIYQRQSSQALITHLTGFHPSWRANTLSIVYPFASLRVSCLLHETRAPGFVPGPLLRYSAYLAVFSFSGSFQLCHPSGLIWPPISHLSQTVAA